MRQGTRWHHVATVVLLFTVIVTLYTGSGSVRATGLYANPLPLLLSGGQRFESCPDPTIIRGQTAGDNYWYLYCTTDPQNGNARVASRVGLFPRSEYIFRFIPTFRSLDLVNWSYVNDAFAARPAWVPDTGYLWTPDVQYFNGLYHLYFTASETNFAGGGSAIGVATSSSPTGPWTETGVPVVAPEPPPGGASTDRRWVYDPSVIADATTGNRYIFFGSYFGGLSARQLSADGLTSITGSETPIAIPNRYEGAYVTRHGGYYYLFASATNCCNGPLTGYSVFVGRSASLLGPYVDRDGVSLRDGRVGGTPVLSMNGNRWVGPGHNGLFTDFAGQDWIVYHAVDRNDPFFAASPGFTKRPALLDPLDWYEGWPTARGGLWASDTGQPGPAAQPGDRASYLPHRESADDALGSLIEAASDEFVAAPSLRSQWSFVRPPPSSTYGLPDGTFRFATQPGELYVTNNSAPVLIEAAPAGEYTAEIRMRFDLPNDGSTHNFIQAGMVIYRDDDNYVKLAHVPIYETRQIEFAKEQYPAPPNAAPPNTPAYGNTVLSAPNDWTYLRIAKRLRGGEEQYTAFSSRDGQTWIRGGTWTHALGTNAKIGLIAFGGAGFTANFDYIRVYGVPGVAPQPPRRPAAPTVPPTPQPPTPRPHIAEMTPPAVAPSTPTALPAGTPPPRPSASTLAPSAIAPQPPRR